MEYTCEHLILDAIYFQHLLIKPVEKKLLVHVFTEYFRFSKYVYKCLLILCFFRTMILYYVIWLNRATRYYDVPSYMNDTLKDITLLYQSLSDMRMI